MGGCEKDPQCFSIGISNCRQGCCPVEIFFRVDDEVILCPTFAAFNDMIEMARAKTITVPLTEDKGYDLDGILEKVNDKTKMEYDLLQDILNLCSIYY